MTSTQEKRAFWKQHVAQWQSSGLSQKSYSETHQLKLHQLVYWIGVFKPKPESSHVPQSKFVPVQVVAHQSDASLKLHLHNGLWLDGITANNLGIVKQLVEVLR